MSKSKKLTRDDHHILVCIHKSDSLKEGLEQAALDLGTNYFSVKNRWYNHVHPILSCQTADVEYDDYLNTMKNIYKDVDPVKAGTIIMALDEDSLVRQWKRAMHEVGNISLKIVLEMEQLRSQNEHLKLEVNRLKNLVGEPIETEL